MARGGGRGRGRGANTSGRGGERYRRDAQGPGGRAGKLHFTESEAAGLRELLAERDETEQHKRERAKAAEMKALLRGELKKFGEANNLVAPEDDEDAVIVTSRLGSKYPHTSPLG